MPDEAPLALVQPGSHGIRITAVNACAAAEGVRIGQALADARASLPALLSRPAEPGRDRAALKLLARWCGRYGPNRNSDGEDGLWIDVTGVAHLFGGEEGLLADLTRRLAGFGLTAKAALADTLGAAHALARFGAAPVIAAAGGSEARLAGLPVEALRLMPDTVLLLRRLGLKRIGQLLPLPRAALERRFRSAKTADAVLRRLDMALGRQVEPLAPLVELPALFAQASFADPLISGAGIEAETGRLARELCAGLDRRQLGAREVCLALYRADGTTAEVHVGLSFACRAPEHLVRLLAEKLATLDAGFGIDALVLAARRVERRSAEQATLAAGGGDAGADRGGSPAELVDRVANRLGAGRVARLEPRASHLPERAQACVAALSSLAAQKRQDAEPESEVAQRPARPPFLLAAPEPIGVIAEVPEGPPASFTWRRVERRVARAQGPERIAPEWWREIGMQEGKPRRTRDYYRIEDEAGAGYWVFREGLYGRGEEGTPVWFLHGLFA